MGKARGCARAQSVSEQGGHTRVAAIEAKSENARSRLTESSPTAPSSVQSGPGGALTSAPCLSWSVGESYRRRRAVEVAAAPGVMGRHHVAVAPSAVKISTPTSRAAGISGGLAPLLSEFNTPRDKLPPLSKTGPERYLNTGRLVGRAIADIPNSLRTVHVVGRGHMAGITLVGTLRVLSSADSAAHTQGTLTPRHIPRTLVG